MSTDGQADQQATEHHSTGQPRIDGKFASPDTQLKPAPTLASTTTTVPDPPDDAPSGPQAGDPWTPLHHAYAQQLGWSEDQMKNLEPDAFLQMAQSVTSRQAAPQHPADQFFNQPPPQDGNGQDAPQEPTLNFPEPPKLNARPDDDLSPAVSEFADQMGQHLKQYQGAIQDVVKQNQRLQQQLQQTAEHQEQEALFASFDQAVNSLLPEEVYGRGRIRDLGEPYRSVRQALLDATVRAEQRMHTSGMGTPGMGVLVTTADQQLRQQFAGPSLQQLSQKSKDRSRQTTSPPASGKSTEPKTEKEKAIAAAAGAMRKHGMIS